MSKQDDTTSPMFGTEASNRDQVVVEKKKPTRPVLEQDGTFVALGRLKSGRYSLSFQTVLKGQALRTSSLVLSDAEWEHLVRRVFSESSILAEIVDPKTRDEGIARLTVFLGSSPR